MLTTAVITEVLSHYDLGTVQGTISALRGFVNETASVQTSEGQFVVRRNNRRNSEAALRYRHGLITRLYTHDFPTASLLPARNGDTLLALDGRFYEVLSFVRGNAGNADQPQNLLNVGATLAHYHTLVQACPPPPDAQRLRYSPHTLLGMTEELLKHDEMGDLTSIVSWYDARIAYLRKLLPPEKYTQLPHLCIHGDIHRNNLLFAEDRVAALLDFDQVAWDTPLCDLADALVAFASCKAATTTWGIFPGPLDEEQADLLIEGYTSVMPLGREEITALMIILEVLWLQGELGRVLSTPEGAPDYHLSVLDQGCQLSRWLNERREYLTNRWLQIANGTTDDYRAAA